MKENFVPKTVFDNKLQLAFAGADRVVPNTGKSEKFEAIATLADTYGIETVPMLSVVAGEFEYDEPSSTSAPAVARNKAGWLKEQLIHERVTAGADTNFFMQKPEGWVHWSKLERAHHEADVSLIVEQYQVLRDLLVFPKTADGHIRMAWEVALDILNGKHHTFSEWILIKAKPIPLELFNQAFDQAVTSGLLLKSNSRMAMIEMLIESGAVVEVGFVPANVVSNQESVRPYMMTPDQALLRQAESDIISTTPHAMFALA
ncbi:MAG: hypothetical protein M3Q81_00805 [bacterium]|nr:hypothetical protein [bacterium]